MLIPEIDWDKCQGCEPCEARLVCNLRAIVIIDPGDSPYIDYSRCSGCAHCVTACTNGAINMKSSHTPVLVSKS